MKNHTFNNYCTSISLKKSSLSELNGSPFPEISHISISVSGVTSLLQNLNPHKAMGSGGIAYSVKKFSKEIAPIFTTDCPLFYTARVYAR